MELQPELAWPALACRALPDLPVRLRDRNQETDIRAGWDTRCWKCMVPEPNDNHPQSGREPHASDSEAVVSGTIVVGWSAGRRTDACGTPRGAYIEALDTHAVASADTKRVVRVGNAMAA